MSREMMSKPLVSIVIPVYNGSDYLRTAIDSALSQSYENCEVIVVNDGSDDGGVTDAICRSYGDVIKYYQKENGGVATAVNVGIKNMRGDYFSWLSHDDFFLPDKIERQMNEIFFSGKEDSVCFGNFIFRNIYTGEEQEFRVEDYCDVQKIENGIYPILFGLIHFCTVLVSKKRIEEVGVCDERLKTTQDVEWLFRLLRYNENIFIKKPLSVIRLHEGQGKRQISEFGKEQGDVHIRFMNCITDDEIEKLFGGRYQYFWEMASFYKRDNNEKAFQYAKEHFNMSEKPPEMIDAVEKVKNKLQSLKGNERLVVFCAGKYGMSLIREMKSRDIRVDFISDNDSKKWGQVLNGISVIPPYNLSYNDLIIVAKDQPKKIVIDLRNQGFINILTYKDIMTMLQPILPVCIPD